MNSPTLQTIHLVTVAAALSGCDLETPEVMPEQDESTVATPDDIIGILNPLDPDSFHEQYDLFDESIASYPQSLPGTIWTSRREDDGKCSGQLEEWPWPLDLNLTDPEGPGPQNGLFINSEWEAAAAYQDYVGITLAVNSGLEFRRTVVFTQLVVYDEQYEEELEALYDSAPKILTSQEICYVLLAKGLSHIRLEEAYYTSTDGEGDASAFGAEISGSYQRKDELTKTRNIYRISWTILGGSERLYLIP